MIIFPYQLYKYEVINEGKILQKFKKKGHGKIVELVIEKGEVVSISDEKFRESLQDDMVRIRIEYLKELSVDLAFLHRMEKMSEVTVERTLFLPKVDRFYVDFYIRGANHKLSYRNFNNNISIVVNRMASPRIEITQILQKKILDDFYLYFETLK